MGEVSIADLIYDTIPLEGKHTYIVSDINFRISENGNLTPTVIVWNNLSDPDPGAFIQLPNLAAFIKKNLFIGDIVDETLELISRPDDVVPAIIPTQCTRCGSTLTINCSRKLSIRCTNCAEIHSHR